MSFRKYLRIIFAPALGAVLLTSAACPPESLAAGDADRNQEISGQYYSSRTRIQEIDRELMLSYIQLARFNIHFYLGATHHQWWRFWTYPLTRESGTCCALAAAVVDLSQLSRGLNHPGKISRSSVRRSTACALTGTVLSGSASALELAQNSWVMFMARKNGYSPRDSLAYVREVCAKTDTLMKERDDLVSGIGSEKIKAVRELESNLFRQIEEQLLFEFRKWSCYSRELAFRENTFFALDAMQNYTAMTSAILALKGFRNPHCRGAVSITSLTAASIATLDPLIALLSGKAILMYQAHKLDAGFPHKKPAISPEISERTLEAFESDGEIAAKTDLSKVALLINRSERFDQTLDSESGAIHRLRAIAQQQAVSGPLIGLASVSRTILADVAQFSYKRAPVPATRLLFAGRIPQIAGQSYALANTVATKAAAVRKNNQLKKRGQLPSQVFAQRLKSLDELERVVRSGKF